MGPSKAATVLEQQWMDAIVQLGCVVCRIYLFVESPASVHHMLRGGVRISHLHTLALCHAHHQGGRNDPQCVSRHPWRKEFERRYGSEAWLLDAQRQLVLRAGLMDSLPELP